MPAAACLAELFCISSQYHSAAGVQQAAQQSCNRFTYASKTPTALRLLLLLLLFAGTSLV
jgi:hypothetical protein